MTVARDSPTSWGLASPVAAVHTGQGHRGERPAERIDEQGDRPGRLRHGALKHLEGVAERATRGHRIPQHHHGVGWGVLVGTDVGHDGVGRVLEETVRTLGPLLDELLGRHMPDNPLGTVGEIQRRRRHILQGQRRLSLVTVRAICTNISSRITASSGVVLVIGSSFCLFILINEFAVGEIGPPVRRLTRSRNLRPPACPAGVMIMVSSHIRTGMCARQAGSRMPTQRSQRKVADVAELFPCHLAVRDSEAARRPRLVVALHSDHRRRRPDPGYPRE
jgi:hypothetical protein